MRVRAREGELTAMVAVGLKATLIFMISPFDIPPCLSTEVILANHIFLEGEKEKKKMLTILPTSSNN